MSFGRNCVGSTFVGMDITPTKTRNAKSNLDVIVDWFEGRIGDHELTKANQEYFARIQMCYRSQMNFHARAKTVKMLSKSYGISERTATRLYNDCEKIYGTTRKFNKEFTRHKAEEMALQTYRKAKSIGAVKTMVQAVAAYIRASGIEMEDSNVPDFAQLEPGDVITMLPPEIKEAIMLQLNGGSVDLNKATYTVEAEAIDITPAADAESAG